MENQPTSIKEEINNNDEVVEVEDNNISESIVYPTPIQQTELIEIKDNKSEASSSTSNQINVRKCTLLHTIGPDIEPLINWKDYSLTSYSNYQPNIELGTNKKIVKDKIENKRISLNIDDAIKEEENEIEDEVEGEENNTNTIILQQTDCMIQNNDLLKQSNIITEDTDRGITSKTTLKALNSLVQQAPTTNSNFITEDLKRNKLHSKWYKYLGRFQTKVGDKIGGRNGENLIGKGERNLFISEVVGKNS